jgi:hypothetical protein
MKVDAPRRRMWVLDTWNNRVIRVNLDTGAVERYYSIPSPCALAIDAGITKFQGGDWFYYGTGALIVFQAGLCLLIDSTRHK